MNTYFSIKQQGADLSAFNLPNINASWSCLTALFLISKL